MKIFIDIGHPAHVHYYKNFIRIMKERNHDVLVTARDRDVIFKLLDFYKIDYLSRGKGSKNLIGKVVYSFYAIYLILYKTIEFKPDIFLCQGGVYTAPVAWLFKKVNISTEDTENAVLSHKIAKLFKSHILSPSCFQKEINNRHYKFDSYQELFYLHPKYFKPNRDVYKDLNLAYNEKFVIVRFVDWNAHHDVGHSGVSIENKIKAIKEFLKYAKVFILSESELPYELMKYRIKIPPERMHDALYYADLLFGESATMASECACLGTPAIFIDDAGRGYTDEEEEKYGLVFNFKESLVEQEKAIQKAVSILRNKNLDKDWIHSQKKIISDKIDATEFLIWFIEGVPKSSKILKDNPDYQLKFK